MDVNYFYNQKKKSTMQSNLKDCLKTNLSNYLKPHLAPVPYSSVKFGYAVMFKCPVSPKPWTKPSANEHAIFPK